LGLARGIVGAEILDRQGATVRSGFLPGQQPFQERFVLIAEILACGGHW
jgi:hypothetical protein